MAKSRTIFPSRPSETKSITAPTEQEKSMFAEKIVECCVNEVDGHRHQLARLVYAVKNIAVSKSRREELHQHLFLFEPMDAQIVCEAQDLCAQINAQMNQTTPPANKADLESALNGTYLPQDVFVQRFIDNIVGKEGASFSEFASKVVQAKITEI